MQYRIDFFKGDKAFYVPNGDVKKSAPILIIAINPNLSPDEFYTIQFLTNRNPVYRKGDQITTSGNWLRKSKPPKK